MEKCFIDVNIPMYAGGEAHEYRNPCQKIIKLISTGDIEAFTNVEVFQEILYRFSYIKKLSLGLMMYANFLDLMTGRILPITEEEILLLQKISKKYPEIKPRDLIHATVMIINEIKIIYSADRDFDKIKEIQRVDPLTFNIK